MTTKVLTIANMDSFISWLKNKETKKGHLTVKQALTNQPDSQLFYDGVKNWMDNRDTVLATAIREDWIIEMDSGWKPVNFIGDDKGKYTGKDDKLSCKVFDAFCRKVYPMLAERETLLQSIRESFEMVWKPNVQEVRVSAVNPYAKLKAAYDAGFLAKDDVKNAILKMTPGLTGDALSSAVKMVVPE